MASTPHSRDDATPTRGRTTIELEQRDDGQWHATQHDVDIAGTGETAALAAMAYCRKIADGQHRE